MTRRYEHEATISGQKETISALAFSPDGTILASGSEDGSITLFSTFDWHPFQTFADASPLTSLVWHPHIYGRLFCGFKSGDVHTTQINRSQVIPHITAIARSHDELKFSARLVQKSGQT